MRFNQEERRKLTAEDLEIVHHVTASGRFILIDIFFFMLFLSFIFITGPEPAYLLMTLLFALYLISSCICLLLIKKKRKKSAK
jgi:ABC-type multidrug transport system permease subunit